MIKVSKEILKEEADMYPITGPDTLAVNRGAKLLYAGEGQWCWQYEGRMSTDFGHGPFGGAIVAALDFLDYHGMDSYGKKRKGKNKRDWKQKEEQARQQADAIARINACDNLGVELVEVPRLYWFWRRNGASSVQKYGKIFVSKDQAADHYLQAEVGF